MSFTESEKSAFIAALLKKGWQLRDDVIWSPGGGLYFNSSHFSDWNPKTMKETFTRRAARIEQVFAEAAAENRDVHLVADEAMEKAQ
ncbi:MAG: hypothetical protein WCD79_12615 [Chthoniobacteraceae bacterium]